MRTSDFPFFDEDPEQSDGTRSGRISATTTEDLGRAPTAGTAGAAGSPVDARGRARKAVIIAMASLLVLAIGIGAVVAYYFSRVDSAIGQVQQESLLPVPYAGQPAETGNAAMNFLVVGADKNDNGTDGRSDVLMIVHLSGDRKNLYLVSLPRDMWVTIPASDSIPEDREAKINAAYAWGRAPLAVRTVEQLTQVKIDHTAEINFGGFVGLTEQLGGVTVANEVASRSGGYTYPRGDITIAGEEALVFVRQRHGLPGGDLDRAERQRAVLSAILDKAMSPAVLGNPAKFGEMIELMSQQVVVDQTLPSSEVRGLIYGLQVRERGNVHSLQVPIAGLDTSPDGQSIVVVDEPRLAELSQALREDTMADYAAQLPPR